MTLYDFAEGNPRCLQDAANKRGRVWLYRPDLLLELGELGMLTGRALLEYKRLIEMKGTGTNG
jgi:hypothetical protein